jgi:hypothetical protein
MKEWRGCIRQHAVLQKNVSIVSTLPKSRHTYRVQWTTEERVMSRSQPVNVRTLWVPRLYYK